MKLKAVNQPPLYPLSSKVSQGVGDSGGRAYKVTSPITTPHIEIGFPCHWHSEDHLWILGGKAKEQQATKPVIPFPNMHAEARRSREIIPSRTQSIYFYVLNFYRAPESAVCNTFDTKVWIKAPVFSAFSFFCINGFKSTHTFILLLNQNAMKERGNTAQAQRTIYAGIEFVNPVPYLVTA